MNRFLPSKKLLVFLVTTLVILGCFFLFFKFKDRKISYLTNTAEQEKTTQAINQEIQQTLKNDSDGDGLKDWEEVLWKTDPNNPDTDGDGTDDNSEILANRNPLVAGPNDLLNKNIVAIKNNQNEQADAKSLTQTDLMSQELFAGYVALKQNNQLGTAQEEQFINNLVTKSLSAPIISAKKYRLGDLNIIQDNSQKALQQYADQLKIIMALGNKLEDEPALVKMAAETKNPQKLEKLHSNISIYQEMQKKLITLAVPKTISEIHLGGINSIGSLANDVSNMLLILEDPITGLKGTASYFDDALALSTNLIKIVDYFNKNNIKFNL